MRRLLPWLLPLALALHLVAVAIWTTGLTALYDLQVYRAGGRALLDGTPLYDGFVFWVLHFTYPPFAAVVFTPLALIPTDLAKIAFSVLNVAALAGVIWLALRALGGPRRRLTATLALTGALFWLEPVRSTITIGQVNLLLLLVVVWDLTRPPTARHQGIGVGIAAGIKLVPGVFVLYLLLTRRPWAALNAAAAFAGTVGLGFLVAPRDSVRYWTGTFLTTGRIGEQAETGNQSLAGMLARFGAPSPVLWVPLALLAGLAGLAVATRAHRRGHELLGVTVCGMTACLAAPFAWSHHWVWFVPLIVLLARTGPRLVPVGLALLLLDWPVTLPPRDWIFPPRTGLIALDGPVAGNIYVLLGLAVVAVTGTWLWSGAAGGPAAAGDLGEHHPGGDGGVERLDAGGHRDGDGLVAGLPDQPGQAAALGADHHDQG
jgi:alpha-1,2-mannosyltransferase